MKINLNLSFLPVLTLVFIVLKLCNVINWSWWLVLLPMIIPIGVILIIVGVILIIRTQQI